MDHELVAALRKRFGKEQASVQQVHYKGFLLDPRLAEPINEQPADLSFIDGGHLNILQTPDIGLFCLRLYGCQYEGKKTRQSRETKYLLLQSAEKGFLPIIYPQENKLDLVYHDESEDAAGFIRECAELEFGKTFMKSDTMLVLDGSFDREGKPRNLLQELTMNNTVVGFSKTSSLLTDEGTSLLAELHSRIRLEAPWLFHVPLHDGFASAIIKLHPASRYVFRLDGPNKDMLVKATQALVSNAKDPSFPGYPYGLVEADRYARVSKREREYMLVRLKSSLGKSWQHIEHAIKSTDAHAVLDSFS